MTNIYLVTTLLDKLDDMVTELRFNDLRNLLRIGEVAMPRLPEPA